MQKLLPIIIGLFAVQTALAQTELYEKRIYTHGKDTLRYRVLFPEGYDASQKYPLVLFLHGAGERGNNNEDQLKHGSKLFTNAEVRKNTRPLCSSPNAGATISGHASPGTLKKIHWAVSNFQPPNPWARP